MQPYNPQYQLQQPYNPQYQLPPQNPQYQQQIPQQQQQQQQFILDQPQSGFVKIGPNNYTNNLIVQVMFPYGYTQTPIVHITPSSVAKKDISEVFAVTIRSVTLSGFTAIISLIDFKKYHWTQDLHLYWMAKPVSSSDSRLFIIYRTPDKFDLNAPAFFLDSENALHFKIPFGIKLNTYPNAIITPQLDITTNNLISETNLEEQKQVKDEATVLYLAQLTDTSPDGISGIVRKFVKNNDDKDKLKWQEGERIIINYSIFISTIFDKQFKSSLVMIGPNKQHKSLFQKYISFDSAFKSAPHIIVSLKNESLKVNDTMCAIVKGVSSSGFTVMIKKADSLKKSTGWDQQLVMQYCAIEVISS